MGCKSQIRYGCHVTLPKVHFSRSKRPCPDNDNGLDPEGGWSPTTLHLDNRSVTQTQGYTNSSIVPRPPSAGPGEEGLGTRLYTLHAFVFSLITLGHANPNPMFCNACTNLLEPSSPSCLQEYSNLPTASTLFTCIHIILHWPHAHLLEEIVS